MLLAATVCPQAPLLVPALAPGATAAVKALRQHCAAAVTDLVATRPSRVVVVAGADTAGQWGDEAGGSLAPYGVAAAYGGPVPQLPLSLTLGAFLLDEAGWSGARRYVAVPSDSPVAVCAQTGRDLARTPARTALLVLGDGSAKRSTAAPGYFDARAGDLDHAIGQALASNDADALLGLDPELANQLWVAGRAAWQVLAGASGAAQNEGASVTARMRYDEAPLGVGYLLADWVFQR
ncbi:MAG: hypothetical protein H0U61_08680 [Nocardioidaceae bacterium]|nr:hypothetical protein [Nocardioidaceae bacterium]